MGAAVDKTQARLMSVDYLRVVLAAFVVVAHSGLARETFRSWGDAGLVALATATACCASRCRSSR